MKLFLALINLHLCVLVPVIIHGFNPGFNGFFLVSIWLFMYLLIYYFEKKYAGKS